MKRDEVRAAVTAPQPARHRADDRLVLVVLDRAVAAQYPDNCPVPVTLPEPLPVNLRVLLVEHLGPLPPLFVPLVTPRREKPDEHPKRLSSVDNVIDMVPIIVPVL